MGKGHDGSFVTTGSNHKLVWHSFIYAASRASPALASVIITALATRSLTPAAYGTATAIASVVAIVSAVTFGWFRQSIFRFSGQVLSIEGHLQHAWRYFWRIVALLGVAAAAVSLVLWVWSSSRHPVLAAVVVVTGVVGGAGSELALERYRIVQRPTTYALVLAGRGVAGVLLVALLLVLGAGWTAIPLGVGLGGLVLVFARRSFRVTADEDGGVPFVTLVRYGWPLGAALGLAAATDGIVRLSVFAVAGGAMVATLALIQDLANQAFGAVAAAISAATYPELLRIERATGRAAALHAHAQVSGALWAALVAGVACFLAYGSWVVTAVSGADYGARAIPYLLPMALAATAAALRTQYMDVRCQLLHRTSRQLVGASAAMLSTTVLLVWFGAANDPVAAVWMLAGGQVCGLLAAAVALGPDVIPVHQRRALAWTVLPGTLGCGVIAVPVLQGHALPVGVVVVVSALVLIWSAWRAVGALALAPSAMAITP
jgi:O-antigen/teichoic acid export membrane protein